MFWSKKKPVPGLYTGWYRKAKEEPFDATNDPALHHDNQEDYEALNI